MDNFKCPKCGGVYWADRNGHMACTSDIAGRPLSLSPHGKPCRWVEPDQECIDRINRTLDPRIGIVAGDGYYYPRLVNGRDPFNP